MAVIKEAVGSRSSWLASLIPLDSGKATGAESPGAPAPGLALDLSRWVAIYRLLNMFRVAGRRDALSLPTSVRVERDGFSPP